MSRKQKIKRQDLIIKHPSLFDKYKEIVHEKFKIINISAISLLFFLPLSLDNLFITFMISIDIVLFILFNFFVIKMRKTTLEQEDVVGKYEINNKNPKTDKYLLFGYAVDSISDIKNPATVMEKNPEVLLYPVFVDKDFTLRHGLIVGTTGSGKTVLIRCLLSQVLASGGGLLIVDGKADQSTYEDFYNTTLYFNREDDFYMLNLSTPEESNTMNPLMSGSIDDIAELLSNMLGEAGGDNQYWVERGQILMKATLSVLIPLRDRNELYFPDKKPADGLSFTLLNKWLGLNELYDLFHTFKDKNESLGSTEHPDYIELKRLESYLMSNGADVQQRVDELPEEATRQHGFAISQWTSAMDTLMGTYGIVFDTQTPQINMFDIVTGGRIMYVMLPALRKSEATLKSLGKLVLATLKISLVALLGDKLSGSIDERYSGFAARPRVPFLAIMDEYGAYAVKGFDNVLAQARSLQVGVIIAVQELVSLEKADEIEAKRILGNTAFKIALKIVEDNTIETFLKIAGEEKTAVANEQNENANEKSFNIDKVSPLDGNTLKKLEGGQGFAIINGKTTPILVAFFQPPVARVIPKFTDYQKTVVGKTTLQPLVDNIDKIKEKFLDNRLTLEIYENIIVNKFEKSYQRELVEEFISLTEAKNLTEEKENFLNAKLDKFLEHKSIDLDKIRKELKENIERLDVIIKTIEEQQY